MTTGQSSHQPAAMGANQRHCAGKKRTASLRLGGCCGMGKARAATLPWSLAQARERWTTRGGVMCTFESLPCAHDQANKIPFAPPMTSGPFTSINSTL